MHKLQESFTKGKCYFVRAKAGIRTTNISPGQSVNQQETCGEGRDVVPSKEQWGTFRTAQEECNKERIHKDARRLQRQGYTAGLQRYEQKEKCLELEGMPRHLLRCRKLPNGCWIRCKAEGKHLSQANSGQGEV